MGGQRVQDIPQNAPGNTSLCQCPFTSVVQVHSDKPGLWVAAAQWEFQQLANADNGRQILLRGLRFLPKSWTMHR